MMNPRRSATVATAFYPAVVVAGWAFVSLAGVASPRIEKATVAHVVADLAPALTAKADIVSASQPAAAAAPTIFSNDATISSDTAPAHPDVTTPAEVAAKPFTDRIPAVDAEPILDAKPVAETLETATAPQEPKPVVVAALNDPAEVLPREAPEQTPPATTTDGPSQDATAPAARIEVVGECIVVEPCIDEFLWALYRRAPKEDTIKEIEKRQVTVKRKGKMVTVTRSFTKLVENDFTWKDPKAAERAGMSMIDYVIGGMDRGFKLKLFHMLHAAEAAGLQPGITSAFRDDYRQSIASGLKAASNRSYHGGSLRGGYGHGLAADIVSVNGRNRAQRWAATEALWKWVDANGKQYGIGRPYLAYDPPHVGPIDGQEYTSRRGAAKIAAAKKRDRKTVAGKPTPAKKPVVASAKPN